EMIERFARLPRPQSAIAGGLHLLDGVIKTDLTFREKTGRLLQSLIDLSRLAPSFLFEILASQSRLNAERRPAVFALMLHGQAFQLINCGSRLTFNLGSARSDQFLKA